MISYISYNLGGLFARHLPPRLSKSITRFIARNQYLIRAQRRKNVARNLRIVLGDTATECDIEALSRNLFVNFSKSIFCFLRLPYMDEDELLGCCDIYAARETLHQLGNRGGFVIAGPHVGPWEMGGACLSALGLRIHSVAHEHPSRSVTRFFEDRRRQSGIQCHPVGRSYDALAQALKAGDCVALLIDRDFGRARKSFSLFGRPLGLPGGHAALSVRCQVPIVTAVCAFMGDDKIKIELRGPYYPDKSLGDNAAIEDLIERCRLDIEWFVRKYPDQWFNFQPI
jgi:lauroyl/myristoyl acyltransferase